jgi:hypothetical protein
VNIQRSEKVALASCDVHVRLRAECHRFSVQETINMTFPPAGRKDRKPSPTT